MKFRLTYEGPLLGSNNSQPRARHKQEIRKRLHPQLKALWGMHPYLKDAGAFSGRKASHQGEWNRKVELGQQYALDGYNFVPLVVPEFQVLCSLDILFLRPGVPGTVLASGDIDNRLKTLFDALRSPANRGELGGFDAPSEGESPHFFCLLSDDKLINRVAVETDVLFEPTGPEAGINDARLVITVEIVPYVGTLANLAMA